MLPRPLGLKIPFVALISSLNGIDGSNNIDCPKLPFKRLVRGFEVTLSGLKNPFLLPTGPKALICVRQFSHVGCADTLGLAWAVANESVDGLQLVHAIG